MSDEGYREIHLTGKQLVFLFMAATVVAVVIFLLGVLVGRGVQADKDPGSGASLVSAPQIVPDTTTAPVPEAPPVSPPAAGAATPAPQPVDERGAPGRLQDKAATPETLKPASPAARETPAPAKTDPDPGRQAAAAKPAAVQAGDRAEPAVEGFIVQVAAVAKRSEADAIVKRLVSKGFRAYVFVPSGRTAVGVFRIRVGGYKSR
jgi:cell division septation protein DedD